MLDGMNVARSRGLVLGAAVGLDPLGSNRGADFNPGSAILGAQRMRDRRRERSHQDGQYGNPGCQDTRRATETHMRRFYRRSPRSSDPANKLGKEPPRARVEPQLGGSSVAEFHWALPDHRSRRWLLPKSCGSALASKCTPAILSPRIERTKVGSSAVRSTGTAAATGRLAPVGRAISTPESRHPTWTAG